MNKLERKTLYRKKTETITFAAALSYDEHIDSAPWVAAKGEGDQVKYMKQIARRYGVPTVTNKDLANRLKICDDDRQIPLDLYRAVAEIFVSLPNKNR